MTASLPRRLAWAVGGLLLVLVLLLVWAAVVVLLARGHLLDARAALAVVRDEGLGRLDEPSAVTALATAQDEADAARALVRQPGPALVARLPSIGAGPAAVRDIALVSAGLLDAAVAARPLVVRATGSDAGLLDPAALVALADELERGADEVRLPLALLLDNQLRLVPGPLREAASEAQEELRGVDDQLADAAHLARAAGGLLGGDRPRTIVVAVMNNAELRGAGGYSATISVVRAEGGRVGVGPFQDTTSFNDEPEAARTVPAPPDVERRFGPLLANSTLWKNVLMSADGPSAAATLCAVARLAPGVPCDGVVLLDLPALADLATLSGPVRLPDGETVEAAVLERSLFEDGYAEAEDEGTPQAQRRAELRAAADAGITDVLRADLGDADTLSTLAEAVRGRRVVVWSADPQEQQDLVDGGAAGSVDPGRADIGLVAMNSLSASKLDYYATRSVDVDVVLGRTSATVTRTVSLALGLPPELPAYVVGRKGGRLTGLLDIAVSSGSTVQEVLLDGAPTPYTVVDDTGSRRVVVSPDLGSGDRRTWTVRTTVPVRNGRYEMVLLPQPLARDALLRVRVRAATGERLQGGDVDRRTLFSEVQRVTADLA